MKTNANLNQILSALKQAEGLTEKMSQDKNGLLDLVMSKNPQMKSVLPILNATKGNNLGSILGVLQGNFGGLNSNATNSSDNSNAKLQQIMSLMPLLNKTSSQTNENVATTSAATKNFGLSPVAKFATKEIVYAISYLLA